MVKQRCNTAPIGEEQIQELVEVHQNFNKVFEDGAVRSGECIQLKELDFWMLLGLIGMVKIITSRLQMEDDLESIQDKLKEQVKILTLLLGDI